VSNARAARRTLSIITVVALGATGAVLVQRADEDGAEPPVAGAPAPEGSGGPEPDGELPEGASSTSRPRPEPPRIEVPPDGPGTFRTAAAEAGRVGDGAEIYRYQVLVEDGIALEPAAAAAEIHAILGDPRGWTTDGESAFELVGDGDQADAELIVKIATPGTVDALCGAYGLDTQGEVNCRIGDEVLVNLRRWVEGSPRFPGPIGEYRALIINHEVGHRIGHGHAGCPGEGEPAPAMMQQIKGLDGCVANAWPYDADGELIEGPWVP
jgi:hypothetical protein